MARLSSISNQCADNLLTLSDSIQYIDKKPKYLCLPFFFIY